MGDWLSPDQGRKYGGALASPSPKPTADTMTPLPNVAGQTARESKSPLHPGSALFWVMGLVAVSLGAAAYSTTVRVGPATASLKLGK